MENLYLQSMQRKRKNNQILLSISREEQKWVRRMFFAGVGDFVVRL